MHHQSDDGRRWTRVECHVEVATTQGWLSRDNPLLSLHALRVLTTHPGLARPLSARASHERGLWPRCSNPCEWLPSRIFRHAAWSHWIRSQRTGGSLGYARAHLRQHGGPPAPPALSASDQFQQDAKGKEENDLEPFRSDTNSQYCPLHVHLHIYAPEQRQPEVLISNQDGCCSETSRIV